MRTPSLYGAQVKRRNTVRGTFGQIERIAFFAPNNELGALLVEFAGSILKCGEFLSSLLGMQQSFHVIGHIWLDDADG